MDQAISMPYQVQVRAGMQGRAFAAPALNVPGTLWSGSWQGSVEVIDTNKVPGTLRTVD
jgi:hypothetical protein